MLLKRSAVSFFLVIITICGYVYPGNSNLIDEKYRSILDKMMDMQKDVDFSELRRLYTETVYYDPFRDDFELRSRMKSALKLKDYNEAIDCAEKILEYSQLDLDAHQVCMLSYKESGEESKEDYEYHAYVYSGLLRSVLSSGSGSKPESAYVITDPKEGYHILSSWDYVEKSQRLLHIGSHYYYRFEVFDPRLKSDIYIYFNMDIAMNWARMRQDVSTGGE